MRTVSFKSVYDSVVQRLGLDPLGDAITYDTARTIAERITERAQTAWQMWDWPTLTLTEERGYRANWQSTILYAPLSEVYYVAGKKYYRVKAGLHPPIGTAPTSTIYWEEFTPTTLIARDQVGRLPIGQVVGVYKSDPSLNGAAPADIGLKYRPTAEGIYISYAPQPTVFICYVVPEPTYTMVPWINGRNYIAGSRVFWFGLGYPNPVDAPGFGEVYRCISTTNSQPPSNTAYWVKEPVPDMFAAYLKAGAAADCLKESTPPEDQIRLARAALWDAEAKGAIEAEIDALLAQGQKHFYIKPYWSDGWCLSEPWLGSTVILLVPEFVITLPDPPEWDATYATMIYRPEIVAIKTAGAHGPSLQAFPSANYPVDTLIKITVGAVEQGWRIDPGPKNPADPNQQTPDDYDSVNNDKHYTKVS